MKWKDKEGRWQVGEVQIWVSGNKYFPLNSVRYIFGTKFSVTFWIINTYDMCCGIYFY
jgi:hypothetical protein